MSKENEYQILHDVFIVDLAKACLTNEKILEICKKELKYQFLDNQSQKAVFKYIFDSHNVHSLVPSIGTIGQEFSKNSETIAFLSQVKKANKIENYDAILIQLQDHIKKIRFSQILDKSVEIFNSGSRDQAYQLLSAESEKIVNFSFKESYYTKLFADFDNRIKARQAESHENAFNLEKCPFGIYGLDEDTKGGIQKGSAALLMARSGKGKSSMMKWIGLHNARLGARVIHFQAEGTEKDAMNLYDAGWTGITSEEISIGSISEISKRKIEKVRRDIVQRGGEIYVYASETFDSMSLEDARNIIIDIEALYGKADLVIFDYLEIFTVKGNFSGEAGERRRREDLGNKMTNIAVEFNVAVLTATQANDISPENYNKPDFVLTRHHISEFKGAVKPFSYFITINQTDEQYAQGIAVLYADKYRYFKAGRRHPIYQALDRARFYDSKKTLDEFILNNNA
jgi:replicative DNA helicase